MVKTRNVTGREHCDWCIDGWCELAGTIQVGQTTYSRGMAPCRWCELGIKRFERHPELETNYGEADVEKPGAPGRVTRPAKPPRAVLPPVAGPEVDEREVAAKQKLAREALNEADSTNPATQEPILAPEEALPW